MSGHDPGHCPHGEELVRLAVASHAALLETSIKHGAGVRFVLVAVSTRCGCVAGLTATAHPGDAQSAIDCLTDMVKLDKAQAQRPIGQA